MTNCNCILSFEWRSFHLNWMSSYYQVHPVKKNPCLILSSTVWMSIAFHRIISINRNIHPLYRIQYIEHNWSNWKIIPWHSISFYLSLISSLMTKNYPPLSNLIERKIPKLNFVSHIAFWHFLQAKKSEKADWQKK